jgi:hypothetical protein
VTDLTRRQTVIGAAAAVVAAAMPAGSMAESRQPCTFVSWDGRFPVDAVTGDLFEDRWFGVLWRYYAGLPAPEGWIFEGLLDDPTKKRPFHQLSETELNRVIPVIKKFYDVA